jgi:diguanylate cyclase (GGDEF)-like protein
MEHDVISRSNPIAESEARPQSCRSPIRVLTLALAFTAILFTIIGGLCWWSYREYRVVLDHSIRIAQLNGEIVHLDEVLTMSARMAAVTGDLRWEKRYRRYEGPLDAAIQETKRLSPGAFATGPATQTDVANIKLVEMEDRAFDLSRRHRQREAAAVLFSDAYEQQKRVYAEGMRRVTSAVDEIAVAKVDKQRKIIIFLGALAAVSVPILAMVWFIAMRLTRSVLVDRVAAARALEEARDELDGRVKERTAELADANELLRREIGERQALQEQRERMLAEALERADHDPLTGLLNHRACHKRLNDEADRVLRDGGIVSIVLMDLDNFGRLNDAYGHGVGDDVLCRVAGALRRCCRPYDVLARFGGDEFALLMPGMNAEACAAVEERIRQSLNNIAYLPPGCDTGIPLSVSIGTAVFPGDGPGRLDALAIANERLQRSKYGGGGEAIEALRTHLSHSMEGFAMLQALVNAVDNKDRYTSRHSEDVMDYSLQIAEDLGCDEAFQHTVRVAALLHDVGKIGIPDHILRKPGKLTEEEFETVKQHPLIGAVIVGSAPGLKDTLDAVRHHHERWDGGGYPLGLRGEETPLMARLMAVADAFSAMTTDRPYRKGMCERQALRILEEGAGAQWDPRCVAAFLRARNGAGRLIAA